MNRSTSCATTAPGSTWLMPTSCSSLFSGSIPRENSRGAALAWRSCSASSCATADASGPKARRRRAPLSTSRSQPVRESRRRPLRERKSFAAELPPRSNPALQSTAEGAGPLRIRGLLHGVRLLLRAEIAGLHNHEPLRIDAPFHGRLNLVRSQRGDFLLQFRLA